MKKNVLVKTLAAVGLASVVATSASAESVKIGFANEVPWAYPGDNNEPLGFVNVIALNALKNAGIEETESVVSEWGGLIPGLNAGRSDMVTGGLYITASRCEAIAFSDPIAKVYDAFVYKKGSPIESYEQIAESGATFVTGAGYNQVQAAKDKGIDNVMEVPGNPEIVAAVMAGRAVAGGMTLFSAAAAVKNNPGLELGPIPGSTYYVGLGFKKENTMLKARVNQGLAEYLGTEEMLADVADYGYTADALPGAESAAGACLMDANR